jgi:multicomponent Na+:H+ antiporter subunit F
MEIILIVAGVLFAAAAVAAIYRIVRGPTLLDRVVASDVLVVTVICAIGADMAVTGHTDNLPVMLLMALFGIVASVSVARFMSKQDDT